MRYESMHKVLKSTVNSVSCTINLLKTISIKSQLRLADFRINRGMKWSELVFQNDGLIDRVDRKKYLPHIESSQDIYSTKNVEVNGIEYNLDTVLVVEMSDNELPVFGQIVDIFITDKTAYLLLKLFRCIYFDDHLYAYRVEQRDKVIVKKTIEIPDIHPCIIVEKHTFLFIVTRYIL